MKIALRGTAAITSCVLAAGLVLTGGGQAVASVRAANGECPEDHLCAYDEEEYVGDMGKINKSDPDMTDEPECDVFVHRVESIFNNSDVTVCVYSKRGSGE
ncbi:peptidase inhibitor family I36 protein [Amycolatopsis decaplanina]|uniref:Secreted protein n=1 Tax=Amycolatopsis decaplanina DSM 44594 TaxID=1284240 RepID=M2YBJ6_9PSEU|nr:peptidase inhibitor family I36 protein [Amycolatopsis decaplanina]EME52227.1 hypothetical protein H074_33976 [Amycolatopsis decaplanina DSM 44594]